MPPTHEEEVEEGNSRRGAFYQLGKDEDDDDDDDGGIDDDDDDEIRDRSGCTSFSYHYCRLPQQLLRLSVLKLDGSSFEVQVPKMASVGELKMAVEEIFSQSPKEGQGKISWSHVWGHFCLCYDGYKLVDDKMLLRSFHIRDGDQLQFIRHLCIDHNPVRRRSRNSRSTFEQPHRTSSAGSDTLYDIEENSIRDDDSLSGGSDGHHYMDYVRFGDDYDGEFKLAHFLKGWLSYARLWSSGRMRSADGKPWPSRLTTKVTRFVPDISRNV